jgi:hypothetical protein
VGEWRESAERGINLCEIGEFAGSRQCILQRIPSGWSRTIKLKETWVGGFDLISSATPGLCEEASLSMVYTGSKKSLFVFRVAKRHHFDIKFYFGKYVEL